MINRNETSKNLENLPFSENIVLYSGLYAAVLDKNAILRLVKTTPYRTDIMVFAAFDGNIYRENEEPAQRSRLGKAHIVTRPLSVSRGIQRNFFIEGAYDSGYKYEVIYTKSRYDSVHLNVKSREKIIIAQTLHNNNLIEHLKKISSGQS